MPPDSRTTVTISLSLSKATLLALLLLLLPVAAWATESRCPPVNQGQALRTVSVFDGPPEERADLVPDVTVKERGGYRSEWSVTYIFQAGRGLFVECRYGQSMPPIVLAPDATTTRCVFHSAGAGKVSLVCLSR